MPLPKVFPILIILLAILATQTVRAARWATVIKSYAIVYADYQLTGPIGKLPRGQRIRVGEVKRKHRTILPMALNGQLAWIKIADIQLEGTSTRPEIESQKIVERNVDEIVGTSDQKQIDVLTENNFLLFRYGTLASIRLGGVNTLPSSGTNYEFQNEDKESKSLSLFLDHKNPFGKWHWGLGLDYLEMDSQSAVYQTLTVRSNLAWVPFQSHLISTEVFGGLLFSGDYRITFKGGEQYQGILYGVEYGVMARLFPQSKFGVAAGLSFFTVGLSGLRQMENPTGDNTTRLTSFHSAQVFAGLTYRL